MSCAGIAAILCVAVVATHAIACNIPVFRYALERWKPDTSEIVVFYDGELSQPQLAMVTELSSQTTQHGGHANAKVIRSNVASETDPLRRDLWEQLRSTSEPTLPAVLIRSKLGKGRFINHWHGSLDDADQLGIFRSPVRDELSNRLLGGQSVVWLLVQSPDQQKNLAAKELLSKTFGSLATKIQLPEGIGLPGSELYADVPLVVKFSVLEIDASDPSEAFLTGLLTSMRKESFQSGEPLLVPVFGRGRALEVIPANDVSAKLIEDLTLFLSGACSCQVKEQNPGFDLLINADWDTELFGDLENRPPDRSAEEGRNRDPVLVPIPPGRK
ncbi:hypothetical protein Pla52n_22120 [Stieleria varia]|uniref:Uncharacterized protein n=2 Tax=Stieleria varia TaxID=2528005 RepID=A0A5C6B3L4_9BACT|nr:hypothetical protein Pla52n_22120 [Stieleria varia]